MPALQSQHKMVAHLKPDPPDHEAAFGAPRVRLFGALLSDDDPQRLARESDRVARFRMQLDLGDAVRSSGDATESAEARAGVWQHERLGSRAYFAC